MWVYLYTGTPTPVDPMSLLTDVVYYYKMQWDLSNYTWTTNEELGINYGSVSYNTNYVTLSGAVLRNSILQYTWQHQSIWIWSKYTSASEYFSAGYDGLANGWGMWISATAAQCVWWGVGYAYSWNGANTSWVWHFLVASFDKDDSGQMSVYLDWQLVGKASTGGSTAVRSSKWISIGRYGFSSTYYTWDLWICFLTESSLSAQTVSDFYNATKWLYGIS